MFKYHESDRFKKLLRGSSDLLLSRILNMIDSFYPFSKLFPKSNIEMHIFQNNRVLVIFVILTAVFISSQVVFGQQMPIANLNNLASVNGTNMSVNYDI